MSSSQPGWFPDPTDHSRFRWWDGARWTLGVSRDGKVWEEPLGAQTTRARRWLPVWAWIIIGLLLLVPVLILSPFVAPIALVILVTGIVALSRGSRTWLRLRSRRAAIGVTVGAAALLLITGGISAAALAGQAEAPTLAEPARFADTSQVSPATAEESPTPTQTPKPKPTKTPTPTPTPVTMTREETVTEAVAFEQVSVEDANLPRGQTAITAGGQPGQRTLTYTVTMVDGVETNRELKSDVLTVAPVTEVTSVGVYDAPPPAAPADSGCDSNYADACVPIASDVDCAWGSGNGPAYFDGVARVVGSDVYDLDRDGDGLACEQ